ncbi:MAG: aspartate aminotransferase family protein [Candidatus Aminicenantaceae bacterium]
MNDIKYKEDFYDLGIYPKRDVIIVEGKGAVVKDNKGNEYIDCVSGHGVANIGHSNEDISHALCSQAKKLITCPGVFYNDIRAMLMEKLISIVPSYLSRVFLCNSGSESVEAALKFARLSSGKKEFICAMRGFHGRTMGALSATHSHKYKKDFLPLVSGFHFVPFNDINRIKEKINENTAGILLELIQGEGGVIIGRKSYIKEVHNLCKNNDIYLIIDEVQTGFCRTGRMFAIEHYNIQPDIMCLAKAMGGGIPIGAVLCSHKIRIPSGKHGSTFGGNPLACASALSAINFMIDKDLAHQSAVKGAYLLKRLREIESNKIRQVRGLGLMLGIELKEKVKPYILKLITNGLLTLPAGTTVLRLLPPLVVKDNQLDMIIAKIKNVLDSKEMYFS